VFNEMKALQQAIATIAAPPQPPPPVPVSWDHAAPCEDAHHCRELVLPDLQLPEIEVARGV
jgi:hypothetical protein